MVRGYERRTGVPGVRGYERRTGYEGTNAAVVLARRHRGLRRAITVTAAAVILARFILATPACSLARYFARLLLPLSVVDAYVLPVAPLASASSSPLSHLHTT